MRTDRAAAATALLGAALLPGCYFLRHAVPTDPSGMEYPADWAAGTFRDQVDRTGDLITGIPGALADHTVSCWRNLVEYPGEGR